MFLCGTLIAVAVRGLLADHHIFKFPVVASILAIVWIVPKGIELESNALSTAHLEGFWYYVAICFFAIFLGFSIGEARSSNPASNSKPRTKLRYPDYSETKLITCSAVMFVFGFISWLLIRGVDTSGMGAGWTGVITMYALFSSATSLSLCLGMIIFTKTRNWIALTIAVASAIPIVLTVATGVRREALFDLVLLTAGSYYLTRGISPPKIAVVAALLIGSVVLNKVGDFRSYVDSGQGNLIDALLTKEMYDFDPFQIEQGEANEVGLAVADYHYINSNGDLEYGADYANSIVSQYVPAFLVGRDFKNSLMFPTLSQRASANNTEIAFSMGSTRTGFSDTYRSFGWLGFIVFGAISYLFGHLYGRAKLGSIKERYLYLVLLGSGLKSITHSTPEFLASLPFVLVISFLVFSYSKVRRRSTKRILPRVKYGKERAMGK